MSSEIKVGSTGTLTTVVQPGNTIVIGNDADAEVFSTPSMIHLMEYAAREALAPFLNEGEESVGIDVHVNHLAATPPQNEVKATATITHVEKNLVSFDIEAHDAWEKIGSGTHRRAIVQTAKLAKKVAPKRKDADSGQGSDDVRSRVELSGLKWSALEYFQVQRSEKWMHVVLNRPRKKNAIHEKMTHELALIVEWLKQNKDQVSVVIFSGAGNNFSTGDDIAELDSNQPEKMQQLSLLRGALYSRLANLPQVTIAAIDGYALGGGFVFAAACDYRLATFNTLVGLPEAKLGWPPNYGVEIIRSALGRSLAIQWSTSGATLSAQQAMAAGFVQDVMAGNQLMAKAHAIADQILANGPEAVAAVKKVLPLATSESDSLATAEFLKCLKSEHAQKSLTNFSSQDG